MRRRAQWHYRWAVFISGTGSNLQALLESSAENLPTMVYSSSPKAAGIGKARRSGIPVRILSSPIDWPGLTKELKSLNIKNIFLLGFMKIVPQDFLENHDFHVLNLHPSLLPLYPGLKAFERAYQEGAALGATIHKVVPEVDAGPIVQQRKMSRFEDISDCRLRLSFLEQSLVREVWNYESL